ncbi:hypothetical protein MBLNU13_g03985t2 [Cladosporium sp. NU13]
MTHRQSCRFKQLSLASQNLCAVCDEPVRGTNVPSLVCNKCFGIKYCSSQCQRDNAAEHDLLCNAYASIPLRPSIEHHLHLFFTADQAQPRFIWVMPSKPLRHAVIDPHGAALDIDSSYGTGDCDGKECYDATLYHTAAFLSCPSLLPNLSLGTVTGIPPLRSMKGNALLGMKHDDSSLDITDVLPSVLPRSSQPTNERYASSGSLGLQMDLPKPIPSTASWHLKSRASSTLPAQRFQLCSNDDVKAYREVTLCYTGDLAFNPHLSHNKSLGLATVGKPLESVKSPVLTLVSLYTQNEDGEFVGKMSYATPGDLPDALRHIEGAERMHALDAGQRIVRTLE